MKPTSTKYIIIIGSILLSLAFLSSCYTEKKARRQVTRCENTYKDVMNEFCGNLHPPKESTLDSSWFSGGSVIVNIDTNITTDTQYLAPPGGENNGIKFHVGDGSGYTIIQTKYVTKTVMVHDTINRVKVQTVENTAKIDHLTTQNNKLTSDLTIANNDDARHKKQRNWWMMFALLELTAIIVVSAIKIFK